MPVDLLAFGTVEPWLVPGETPRPRPLPLLGLAARIGVGYRISARNVVVRLGPRIEIAVSGVPEDGLRVATISVPGDSASGHIFRAGGVELAMGIDLALWFDVGR